ncbi:MAG: beta family protein [Aminipila sp.]
MQNQFYVPVLKWKKGEQFALKELFPHQRNGIIPLLEITDYLTPEVILENINSCHNQPVYIDTLIAAQDDRDYLISVTEQSIQNACPIYPVLYYDDFPEISEELKSFVKRIAYRISLPESIDGPDLYETIQTIEEFHHKNQDLLIDIILDLGVVVKENEVSRELAETKDTLKKYFLNKSFFNKIIICVSSFPENITNVAAGETVTFKRYDIKLFKKIINNVDFEVLKESLIYADYGVTKFTDTELDFTKMKYGILPKVKYTTANEYIVLKGKRNKAKQMELGYVELSKKIVDSDYYYGEEFSFGDKEIKIKASNGKGPGNNQNWVTIVANHHIAAVIDQLSK